MTRIVKSDKRGRVDINDLKLKKDVFIIYVGPNKIVDQLNVKEMNNIQLTALSIASLGYNNYDFLKSLKFS